MACIKSFVIFIVAALITKVLFKQFLLHNRLNIAGNEASSFQMIKCKWGVRYDCLDGFASNNKAVYSILYIS